MRLYERFRLVAHHDLADGRPMEAIADAKKALSELSKAKPNDQLAIQRSLLELGGMYLAEGKPKEALDCYNEARIPGSAAARNSGEWNELAAQSAAGKGFCFLKLKETEKASTEFRKALQLYKDKPQNPKTIVFPIDLCSSCCAWGLEQSARLHANPHGSIDFTLIENRPLPCECVTSRSILSSSNPPGIPNTVTASGVKGSDNTRHNSGTASGAQPNLTDDASLQNSWSTLIQAGKRHLRDNEEEQAERYFKSAINLLRKNNDKGVRLVESLQALSFFYIEQSRAAEGLPYLKEEIDVQRARFGNDDAVLVAPLCRYGSACLRLGKLDEAEKALTESVELSDRVLKDESDVCAIVHSNLSELRLQQQRFSDAETHAQIAIRIFEKYSPLNKVRIGGTKFTLAKALIAQNKLAEAQGPMKESMNFIEMKVVGLPMKEHVLLADTDLAVRLNDFSSARRSVVEARRILEQMKSRQAFRTKVTTSMETRLLQLEKVLGVATK